MGLRFSVLASGSSGNASLIEADGFGVLLDAGLGPRQLASRLKAIGRDWHDIHAMLLTHTHSDHWNDRVFATLQRHNIPLFCHADHHIALRGGSPAFTELRDAGYVRGYEMAQSFQLSRTMTCTPLPVKHDETTCGFRFEATMDLFGRPQTLAYAADLGCWTADLADALANTDILALEFNHDEFLERTSRRNPALIKRVLGDRGHLSNAQAADLLREILKRSEPGRPQHVVQLHLSRQCNRPAMAADAARVVVEQMQADVAVHTARQNAHGPTLTIGEQEGKQVHVRVKRVVRRKMAVVSRHSQPLLPGWEDG
ncbi:MAG TPA: MBL fold metallo-hydrolase [Gemmataceae bacterium]|nr:MBL fold metallo-hydrolase [Gemmataceae bacterium]